MFKSAFLVFMIRCVSSLLAFAAQLYISRKYGVSEYGDFSFIVSTLYIVSTVSVLGLDYHLLIRGARTSLVNMQSNFVLFSSFVILTSLVLSIVPMYITINRIDGTNIQFVLLVISSVVFSLNYLRSAYFRVLRREVTALLPDAIYKNLILISFVFFFSYIAGDKLDIVDLTTFSFILSLGLPVFSLLIKQKTSLLAIKLKKIRLATYFGFFYLSISLMQLLLAHTDIQMLGYLDDSKSVGLYSAASKISILINFSLMSMNFISVSRISKLMKDGNWRQVNKISNEIRLIGTLVALFFTIAMFFVGKYILNLFGKEYLAAYNCLIILSISQVFYSLVGPSSIIINAKNKQHITFIGYLCAAILNVIMNFALIPSFKIEGAAIASLTSMMFLTIYLFILCKKLMKIVE